MPELRQNRSTFVVPLTPLTLQRVVRESGSSEVATRALKRVPYRRSMIAPNLGNSPLVRTRRPYGRPSLS